jgi:S1-C subfamily serine protease
LNFQFNQSIKITKAIYFFILLISISLTSCTSADGSNIEESASPLHTISFYSNGGSNVSKIRKPYGTVIEKPKDPSKFSFVFEGWYHDVSLIEPVFWPLTLTYDQTFHAAWGKKPLNENEVFNLFKESVFKIKIQNSNRANVASGSGFIIKSDGTFITNAHVMEDAWYAYGDFDHEVNDYEVEWIYQHNSNRDYTIGKLKASSVKTFKTVEISTRYQAGTDVYAIGYPNNTYQRKVTSGSILETSYRPVGSSIDYIRNNAVIDHGSSGGILANHQGKVIGITTAGFGVGSYGAVPIDYVSNWFTTSSPTTFNRLSPLDFYHPEVRVDINSSNVFNFFSISVNLNSSSANFGLLRASYSVISEWIGSEKWYLLTVASSISIVVKININYSYRTSYNYTSTLNSLELITLRHYSINSRFGSDTSSGSAYFSINYGSNNTLLSATDSYTIFSAYGTIASR